MYRSNKMVPLLLSNRARNTPASPIRRLAHLARAAEAAGKKVCYLNIGQPDIKTPKEFLDAVHMFSGEVVAYEASEGTDALRNAWIQYMNRTLNLDLEKEHMLVTTGASEALIFTFMTCCDPGDDVLIFDPTYANYMSFAAISGVRLVSVMTKLKHGFALPSIDEIAEKITNRTRVLLLCNPNNPTGQVYTKEEIQKLLDLCNDRNIFFVVDETYREIVYDGRKPLSVFHLDPDNKRIIVIDSLSKRFSLCGARLGCMLTKNEEVLAKALNQAQARLACSSIEQFAAAQMLREIDDSYLEGVRAEYERRRDVLYEGLLGIDCVEAVKPQGAFYTLVRLPFREAEQFSSFMLSEFEHKGSTLFAAPAAGFYMQGESGKDKIRLGFMLNEQALKQAVEVLAEGVVAYKQRNA